MMFLAALIYYHLAQANMLIDGLPAAPGQGLVLDLNHDEIPLEHARALAVTRGAGTELRIAFLMENTWLYLYSAKNARRLAWFILWRWWVCATWFGLRWRLWMWAHNRLEGVKP